MIYNRGYFPFQPKELTDEEHASGYWQPITLESATELYWRVMSLSLTLNCSWGAPVWAGYSNASSLSNYKISTTPMPTAVGTAPPLKISESILVLRKAYPAYNTYPSIDPVTSSGGTKTFRPTSNPWKYSSGDFSGSRHPYRIYFTWSGSNFPSLYEDAIAPKIVPCFQIFKKADEYFCAPIDLIFTQSFYSTNDLLGGMRVDGYDNSPDDSGSIVSRRCSCLPPNDPLRASPIITTENPVRKFSSEGSWLELTRNLGSAGALKLILHDQTLEWPLHQWVTANIGQQSGEVVYQEEAASGDFLSSDAEGHYSVWTPAPADLDLTFRPSLYWTYGGIYNETTGEPV